MREQILNQDFSSILSGTSLGSGLSEADVKKLMVNIADDIGGGSSTTIGSTGKIGAFGFNVDALQEVGALVPDAKEKLLKNASLNTDLLDRVKTKVTKEFNPLSGGFSLDSLGKNLQGSLLDKVKDKIGTVLPDNINLASANNLNFAALSDPSLWKAPVGSATDNLQKTLGTSINSISNVSSNLKSDLAAVKSNILSRVKSDVPGIDGLASHENTIIELSKTINSSLTTLRDNLPSSTKVNLPENIGSDVDSFSQNTNKSIDTLKNQIDSKLNDLRELPADYLVEERFSEIETLLTEFEETQNQANSDFISSKINQVGGGAVGFLNDQVAQNEAMIGLLDRNYKKLLSARVINSNTPLDTVMGLLSVANGQGPDAALKFAKGIIKNSSNGKSSLDLFNVGSKANNLFDDALNMIASIDTGISATLPFKLPVIEGAVNPTITNQESNSDLYDANPNSGFKDPNSIYPRRGYLERENSDVNPAAIGNNPGDNTVIPYEETTHGQNDSNVAQNKQVNGRSGETVSQPVSEYNAQYPHNHVYQSESGHIQEFDDTPGSERTMLGHRSGTFTEVGPDGTQVNRIVGHSYTIIDNHGTITIEGKANVHVGGTCNIFVGNDANISVGGKTRIDTHGKIEWFTGDDFHLVVGGDFNVRTNKFSIDANEIDMAAEDTFALGAKGTVGISSNAKVGIETSSNITLKAGFGVLSSAIDTPVLEATTAKITTLNAGSTNLKATGSDSDGDSHNLDVAGPTTASVDAPSDAEKPNPTILPDPIPASTSKEPEVPDYISKKAGSDEQLYDGDDGITDRTVSNTDDGDAPSGGEEESVTSNKVAPTACDKPGLPAIDSSSADNKSFKLSEKFNLGQVAFGRGNTKRIRAYGGFSKQDMVTNLRCLAVNCLDPIKERYPGIVITSGFRDFIPQGGSTTSQHLKGMAVDMSFTGYTRSEHIDIAKWIVQNVPYDQCLLEFTANSHWIHISFDHTKQAQRYQHFTMYRHRRVTPVGTFKSY